jgi:lipoprotein NlpI
MRSDSPWVLLRRGNAEEAILQIQDAYSRQPNPSNIMELGVAYLWLGNYQAAWEHFYDVLQTYPRSMSVFYGMCGAAKWCMDEPDKAVSQWRAGLNAQYADAGGAGVRLPLLLYFGSVVNSSVFSRTEAEGLLAEKASDPRAQNWLGPLAGFVTGRIDENELQKRCTGGNEADTRSGLWLADFYAGVVEMGRGNVAGFKEAMRKILDTTVGQTSDEKFFLSCLWQPEFFLARHELQSDADRR